MEHTIQAEEFNPADKWTQYATSLYAAFGLLAGIVALQLVIARHVYKKVL